MNSITRIFSVICACLLLFSVQIAGAATAADATANQSGSVIAAMIDINSADAEMLTTLPGIGAKMAERIMQYRQENGPFKSVDDLLNVKGIGPKVLEKFRDRIEVI